MCESFCLIRPLTDLTVIIQGSCVPRITIISLGCCSPLPGVKRSCMSSYYLSTLADLFQRQVSLGMMEWRRDLIVFSLGQFNKASIRIGFGLYAYPMLSLAYLVGPSYYESGAGLIDGSIQGQGARLITDPNVIGNVFYLTIPGKTGGGLYWIVFVFGILATVSRDTSISALADVLLIFSSSLLKVRRY